MAATKAWAAPARIAVFTFEAPRNNAAAWMCPALSDYAAGVLRQSRKYSPVPDADLERAVAREGLPVGAAIPFEKKDSVRARLGADLIAEGTCSMQGSAFEFKGSVADLVRGTLVRDISFRTEQANVFVAQSALAAKLKKSLNLGTVPDKPDPRLLGTSSRKAYEWMWQGREAARSGDTTRAASMFESALKESPGYLDALLDLATIRIEQTRFREGIALLDRALKAAPKDDRANFLMGLGYIYLLDLPQAERYLNRALGLRPDVAEYNFQMGLLMEKLRRYPDAVKRYAVAVKLDDRMIEAWYHLAVMHALLRNETPSLNALEQAIRLGGDTVRRRADGDADFDFFRGPKQGQPSKSLWNRRFLHLMEK